MQQNKPRLSISYQFDSCLMYLIQEVSKRPSAEIVAFFYELASQVANIGIENMEGKGIYKHIINYFPGTSVPFEMLVHGRLDRYKQWIIQLNAEVGFPESRTYMKEEELQKLSVLLMENKMLGGDEVVIPDFEKPKIRTPKMFKELMEAFGDKPQEN